jgi:hypothetical protein
MIFKTRFINIAAAVGFCLTGLIGVVNNGWAHCDTLDGPVVKAAQKALETGDINLVLIWVQKKDEAEIKSAFERARTVRKISAETRVFADMYFFETLVRIHRAGEGEPYTGLKPAGHDLGLAIPAADNAIADGKIEPVFKLLNDAVHEGLHERFKQVMAMKDYNKDDVVAGREYVEAYVTFMHYVEGIYEAASKSPHGHQHATEDADVHKQEH